MDPDPDPRGSVGDGGGSSGVGGEREGLRLRIGGVRSVRGGE